MPDKRSCFIVGPIGESGTATRKLADLLLNLVIKPILEAEDLNYSVKRADEDADPGSITSALISDLINADLVIADLTGFNPNAFYELGIRHAIQKPTIHIIAQQASLPFDNKDQRTIFVDMSDFDDMQSAKTRLRNAVVAIDIEGYSVSNPVTQAKAVTALRESGDPRDNLIANLEERLARLEKSEEALKFDWGAGRTSNTGELIHALRDQFQMQSEQRKKRSYFLTGIDNKIIDLDALREFERRTSSGIQTKPDVVDDD